MKVLALTVFIAVVAATQAFSLRSPAITLKDYYAQHIDEQSRIISGQPAARGQFPWQVAVQMQFPNGQGAFCGGSLISPGWVLTAAHCADGVQSWTITLGTTKLNLWNDPDKVVSTTTDGFHHENYNDYLNNDIALIRLPSDIKLTDTIQPIRLPSRSEVNDPLENVKVTVSGWGKTSENGGVSQNMNFVQLDTISNSRCAQVYGSQTIISSTICAVGHPEHSTCNGDSGGPLIRIGTDGKPTQIGVVSFVHNAGCASGNPSGYVRTAKFLDWIQKNTGIPIRD